MIPKKSNTIIEEGCSQRNIYKLLAEASLAYLNNESVPDDILSTVCTQMGSFDKTYDLYSSVLRWVKTCLQLPLPLLKIDSAQEAIGDLKLPLEEQKDIVRMVQNYRSKTEDTSRNQFYPKMENFRWRIDITISSSVLARVLEPSLLFEVTCDGKKKVFEVSIAKFHQIRYSVALALKELENLEKKKLLKS